MSQQQGPEPERAVSGLTGGYRVCPICNGKGELYVKSIQTETSKLLRCPVQQCVVGMCAPHGAPGSA